MDIHVEEAGVYPVPQYRIDYSILARLEPSQSVLFRNTNTSRASCAYHQYRIKLGYKFTCKQVGPDVRIWRIS